MAELSWFCLSVASHAEFDVEAALREIGHDGYCPSVTHWRKTPSLTYRAQTALFPGYLFGGLRASAHGPNGAECPFDEIKAIKGVVGILGTKGAPIEIPYDPPDPEFTRVLRGEPVPFSILGLRMREQAHAFDFTRNSKRARKAMRRAQLTFKSFADLGRFVEGRIAA